MFIGPRIGLKKKKKRRVKNFSCLPLSKIIFFLFFFFLYKRILCFFSVSEKVTKSTKTSSLSSSY